jgi:hypothetical protein
MGSSEIRLSQLQTTATSLLKSLADILGLYRPELYYMRGPGPKWRAKNLH